MYDETHELFSEDNNLESMCAKVEICRLRWCNLFYIVAYAGLALELQQCLSQFELRNRVIHISQNCIYQFFIL